MSVTLANLRTTFYEILREEQDTSAYPLTLVDLLLNDSQLARCSWTIDNPVPINPSLKAVKKWKLPFLQTDKFYSNVAPTYTTADVAVGDVTLNVSDTTNFPSTGVLYINWNVTPYSAKTATTFTVSNILFAHLSWAEVSIAFAVPSDFMSIINVSVNGVKLAPKQYDDILEDMNSYKMPYNNANTTISNSRYAGYSPFYTIKGGAYIILFNTNDTGDRVLLRYEKKPTTLTASWDTCTIDNDTFAQLVIPAYAVGKLLYYRWEETRGSELINFAMAQGKAMYAYYDNQWYEEISWVQYKTQKWKLNI